MGIRKATTAFLTKPGLGRTLAVSGVAGAGAAALAHLINMPKEDQAAVAVEAEERGLTPLELVVGALVATGTGVTVNPMDTEAEQQLNEHRDSPESEVMVEALKKAEAERDVSRRYQQQFDLGRRMM